MDVERYGGGIKQIGTLLLTVRSERLTAADHANQYDDDGDHQKHVNKSADGVRRDESEEPQDQQHYCNGIEHFFLSMWVVDYIAARRLFCCSAVRESRPAHQAP